MKDQGKKEIIEMYKADLAFIRIKLGKSLFLDAFYSQKTRDVMTKPNNERMFCIIL